MNERWYLTLGDTLIATIQGDGHDFPWTLGTLIESPEFERYRVYFSDDEHWPDTQAFEDLCEEIHHQGRFVLVNVETGERFHNLTLNHDGDAVWFRYS
ncbi:MAG TPA: hypothetical protein VN156_17790 [Pseudomonas sp.]|nr:hypothetical protein [Pseudomonas sp.]